MPEKNSRKSKPKKTPSSIETASSIESKLNREAVASNRKSNQDGPNPVDCTSVQHAQEMWNKSKKKNKFTYFDKKTVQKDLTSESNAMESWAKKKPAKKGAFLKKRGAITSQTIQEATTTTTKCSKIFDNGLFKDVNEYLRVDASHTFVVAKRKNILLPSNHIKAAGLITNSDFKSLQIGPPSIDVVNYICDYLIKPSHLNLKMFADEILKGKVPFQFSINDKNCFLPSIENGYWELLIFNTKKAIYSNISTSPDTFSQQSKMERFSEFIDSYNESSKKQRLRPFQHWKEYKIPDIEAVAPHDSAILILYYVYKMSTDTDIEDFDKRKLRKIFLDEILQYSEDVSDICLICGQENDKSRSESITWTSCTTLGSSSTTLASIVLSVKNMNVMFAPHGNTLRMKLLQNFTNCQNASFSAKIEFSIQS